ncbi:hypothetical protein GW17_00016083 [Ensete ventricosum]|nr:hypothetical protein GW17_00016083 [Ensete ventricosum]
MVICSLRSILLGNNRCNYSLFVCSRSTISREKFEELCADLWERAFVPVKEVLRHSGLKIDEIYAVELIGGATRVPKLQVTLKAKLQEFLGRNDLDKHLDADEAIVLGSSLHAANLSDGIKLNQTIRCLCSLKSLFFPIFFPGSRASLFSTPIFTSDEVYQKVSKLQDKVASVNRIPKPKPKPEKPPKEEPANQDNNSTSTSNSTGEQTSETWHATQDSSSTTDQENVVHEEL